MATYPVALATRRRLPRCGEDSTQNYSRMRPPHLPKDAACGRRVPAPSMSFVKRVPVSYWVKLLVHMLRHPLIHGIRYQANHRVIFFSGPAVAHGPSDRYLTFTGDFADSALATRYHVEPNQLGWSRALLLASLLRLYPGDRNRMFSGTLDECSHGSAEALDLRLPGVILPGNRIPFGEAAALGSPGDGPGSRAGCALLSRHVVAASPRNPLLGTGQRHYRGAFVLPIYLVDMSALHSRRPACSFFRNALRDSCRPAAFEHRRRVVAPFWGGQPRSAQ